MQIREYEALSVKECLLKVKEELGPEAIILETRHFKRRGLMGIGATDAVKVVAATGVAVTDGVAPASPPALSSEPPPKLSAADARQYAARSAIRPDRQNDDGMTERIARLEAQIHELRYGDSDRLPSSSGIANQPEPGLGLADQIIQRLCAAEVDSEIAGDLTAQLPDLSGWGGAAQASMADSALNEIMARHVTCTGALKLTPGELKKVALVGPTGVGKTTTIAKLAAHYALLEKKRVALLTVDTYRIAAVEQLRTYSQIMGLPLQVAYEAGEVETAIRRFRNYDLLLIDTAGRSQKHVAQMDELKAILAAADTETHLVLAAPTKERDMLDAAQRFSAVGLDRLIFTKLDETILYGNLFNAAVKTRLPVSYFTTGQKVPEDIEPADSHKLVSFVLASAPTENRQTVAA